MAAALSFASDALAQSATAERLRLTRDSFLSLLCASDCAQPPQARGAKLHHHKCPTAPYHVVMWYIPRTRTRVPPLGICTSF